MNPAFPPNHTGSIQVTDQAWHAATVLYAELSQISAVLSGYPLLPSLWYAVKIFSALFVVVFFLEMVTGGNLRRYWTRNFRTDMTYGIFYVGGIYNLLFYAPLVAGLTLIIPTWDFRLLNYVPGPMGFVMYWLIADALGYWIHRLYHHNPILWEFHKVHHAQTKLTFVTSWRNHVVEQIASNVLMFVPVLVLGLPLWYWAPVTVLQYVFEGLQHSDIKWRFGKLYPILVSPVFHALHHSPDRARHDTNYGKILSVWDHLFGTISVGDRPARYGVAGIDMPVSVCGTVVAPFLSLWKQRQLFFAGRSKSSV
jgi:sterol desaturase/sphingolipid hydroxylase (fatty acid hydroxylase superfamily)